MEINLTEPQIEAIQKLLASHSEIGGQVPDANVCFRAYKSIEKQTGITKITEKDLVRNKRELKKYWRKNQNEN